MSISENLIDIRENIERAKSRSLEPDRAVELVVVSKNRSLDEIEAAYKAGVRHFGENRVQELLDKLAGNRHSDIEWHLIGHLQRNKVRQIVCDVKLIHSLDSLRLAREIEKRAAANEVIAQALVQVNIAQEDQKFGFPEEDVRPFLESIKDFPHLRIQGLMFIAPNAKDKEEVRPYFRRVKEMYDQFGKMTSDQIEMRWLSMGMSDDYIEAIEEGANMVRIGSAVFSDGH